MKTLKQIFDKADLKDFDWFGGWENNSGILDDNEDGIGICVGKAHFSLADLLANKSWCKCVWKGTKVDDNSMFWYDWQEYSARTFMLLQKEGEQKALDYIFKTMS